MGKEDPDAGACEDAGAGDEASDERRRPSASGGAGTDGADAAGERTGPGASIGAGEDDGVGAATEAGDAGAGGAS